MGEHHDGEFLPGTYDDAGSFGACRISYDFVNSFANLAETCDSLGEFIQADSACESIVEELRDDHRCRSAFMQTYNFSLHSNLGDGQFGISACIDVLAQIMSEEEALEFANAWDALTSKIGLCFPGDVVSGCQGQGQGSCDEQAVRTFYDNFETDCGITDLDTVQCETITENFISSPTCASTFLSAQGIDYDACESFFYSGQIPVQRLTGVASVFERCFPEDDDDDDDDDGHSSGQCDEEGLFNFFNNFGTACGVSSYDNVDCQALLSNVVSMPECSTLMFSADNLDFGNCEQALFSGGLNVQDVFGISSALETCFSDSDDDSDSSNGHDGQGDEHVCDESAFLSFFNNFEKDCGITDLTASDVCGKLTTNLFTLQSCLNLQTSTANLDFDACEYMVNSGSVDISKVSPLIDVLESCFPDDAGQDEEFDFPDDPSNGFDPNSFGGDGSLPDGFDPNSFGGDGGVPDGFDPNSFGRRNLQTIAKTVMSGKLSQGTIASLRRLLDSSLRVSRRSLLEHPSGPGHNDYLEDQFSGMCIFGIIPLDGSSFGNQPCPVESLDNLVANFTEMCGIAYPNATSCQTLENSVVQEYNSKYEECIALWEDLVVSGLDIPEVCSDYFDQPLDLNSSAYGGVLSPFFHVELADLVENCTGDSGLYSACEDTNEYPCLFGQTYLEIDNRTVRESCEPELVVQWARKFEENCFSEAPFDSLVSATCDDFYNTAANSECGKTITDIFELEINSCPDLFLQTFNGSSTHQQIYGLIDKCVTDKNLTFIDGCTYYGNNTNPYELCLFNGTVPVDYSFHRAEQCPQDVDRAIGATHKIMDACNIEDFSTGGCSMLVTAGNDSDACRQEVLEYVRDSYERNHISFCGQASTAVDGTRNHTELASHIWKCFIADNRTSGYDIYGPCRGVELDGEYCLFNKLEVRNYTEQERAHFKCRSTKNEAGCEMNKNCFLRVERHDDPYHNDYHHDPYHHSESHAFEISKNRTAECTYDFSFNYCSNPYSHDEGGHWEDDMDHGSDYGGHYGGDDEDHDEEDREDKDTFYHNGTLYASCPMQQLIRFAEDFHEKCEVEDIEEETCESMDNRAQMNVECAKMLINTPELSKEEMAGCKLQLAELKAAGQPDDEDLDAYDDVLKLLEEYEGLLHTCPSSDDEEEDEEPADAGPVNCCEYDDQTCNSHSQCNYRYNCAPRYDEWENHPMDFDNLTATFGCDTAASESECESKTNCVAEKYSIYNDTLNEMQVGFECKYRLCYQGGINCESLTDESGERRCRLRGKCEQDYRQHEPSGGAHSECHVPSSVKGWELKAECGSMSNCKVYTECRLRKAFDNGLYDHLHHECGMAGHDDLHGNQCLNVTQDGVPACEVVDRCDVDWENYCDEMDPCCNKEDKETCDSSNGCSFHQECLQNEHIECGSHDKESCDSTEFCKWMKHSGHVGEEGGELMEVCKTIGKASTMNLDFVTSLAGICKRSHMCPQTSSDKQKQTCLRSNAIVLEDAKSCRSTKTLIKDLISGVKSACNETWVEGGFPDTCQRYEQDFNSTSDSCKQAIANLDDRLPRGNCLADRMMDSATPLDELRIMQLALICSGDELEPYFDESDEEEDSTSTGPSACPFLGSPLMAQLPVNFQNLGSACFANVTAMPKCGDVEWEVTHKPNCKDNMLSVMGMVYQAGPECYEDITELSVTAGRLFEYVDKCYEDGEPFMDCPSDGDEEEGERICLFGSPDLVVYQEIPAGDDFAPDFPDNGSFDPIHDDEGDEHVCDESAFLSFINNFEKDCGITDLTASDVCGKLTTNLFTLQSCLNLQTSTANLDFDACEYMVNSGSVDISKVSPLIDVLESCFPDDAGQDEEFDFPDDPSNGFDPNSFGGDGSLPDGFDPNSFGGDGGVPEGFDPNAFGDEIEGFDSIGFGDEIEGFDPESFFGGPGDVLPDVVPGEVNSPQRPGRRNLQTIFLRNARSLLQFATPGSDVNNCFTIECLEAASSTGSSLGSNPLGGGTAPSLGSNPLGGGTSFNDTQFTFNNQTTEPGVGFPSPGASSNNGSTEEAGCQRYISELQYVGSECFEDGDCGIDVEEVDVDQCLRKITSLQGIPETCIAKAKKDKNNVGMNANANKIFRCVNNFDSFSFSKETEVFETCNRCEDCYQSVLRTILAAALQSFDNGRRNLLQVQNYYDICKGQLSEMQMEDEEEHSYCGLEKECHDLTTDKFECQSAPYCSYYQRCNVHYGPVENVKQQIEDRFMAGEDEMDLSAEQSGVCNAIKDVLVEKMTAGEKPCPCNFGMCDCNTELGEAEAMICTGQADDESCDLMKGFKTRYGDLLQTGYSMGAEVTVQECRHYMDDRARGESQCQELEELIIADPSLLNKDPVAACNGAGESTHVCEFVIESFQGLTRSNRLEFGPETFTQICNAYNLDDVEQLRIWDSLPTPGRSPIVKIFLVASPALTVI